MRTKKTGFVAAVSTLVGGAAFALGGATTAQADTSRVLPVLSVGEVVVDSVHQRLFISDATGRKVVATTYDGTVVATHTVNHPSGLALSADAQRLYVASVGDRAIIGLETGTLAEAVRYPAATVQPTDVAVAGGKIWFSYVDSDSGAYDNGVGSIDPAAATPAAVLAQAGEGWRGAPELHAAAANPNRLIVSGHLRLAAFDVSDGTAELLAETDTAGEVADLAVSADGETIATVDPSRPVVTVRDVASIATARTLPVGENPRTLGIATDGAIAGGTDSPNGPDLHVFTSAGKMIRQYDIPGVGTATDREPQMAAMAWEPKGSRLFAVSRDTANVYSLRVYTEPRRWPTKLTLAGPATAVRAKPVTFTGTLSAGVPLPAGTPVTVTRLDLNKPSGTPLTSRKLDAAGRFTLTDSPWAGGKVTYRFRFAGSATHGAVTADKVIRVSRVTPALTLDQHNKVFNQGATVTFTARLGATYKSRTVELWADPYGTDQARRLLKRGVVNSKGQLSATMRLTRNTSVTATFGGDVRTAERTVKSVALVKVNVSNTLRGNARTAKIDGTDYRHYRSIAAEFDIRMTPYPGREAFVEVEYYSGGRWLDREFEYFEVPSDGRVIVMFERSPEDVNARLRVRASYHQTATDSVNHPSATGYSYFTFTR